MAGEFLIHTTVQAVDMVSERLKQKAGLLGIAFVGTYGEKRIPKYPAIVVTPGSRAKEVHATNTFQVLLSIDLYVYHGDLTRTKRERTRDDLQLVADVEEELESDYIWMKNPPDPLTGQIIFGYISGEEPGRIQPFTNKSDLIVGTRMSWRGLTQRRF